MRASASVLAALAALSFAPRARAIDPRECTDAAEAGQRARAAGKLRAAQQKFVVCQTQGCPNLVQQDCSNWAGELAATMPSIVVDARDATGHDLANVTVLVDGEVIMTKLDGKAVALDPGPHVIVFEHVGHKSLTENLIIKEGVKGRVVTVKFEAADASHAPSPSSAGSTNPVSEEAGARGHTAWPWVVVGVGATVLIVGVTFAATAPSIPAGCNEDTQICDRIPNESEQAYKDRQSRAGEAVGRPGLGIAIGAVGGGILLAGLLWHFLEPTGPSTSGALRLAPWSTASGAGLGAFGSF